MGYDHEQENYSNSYNCLHDVFCDVMQRSFCYKINDANTCHTIIKANDIVASGSGTVKITIGSEDSWLYSRNGIANMVDKGF